MRLGIKGLIIGALFSGSALAGTFNLDKEHVPGELIVKFRGGAKSFAAITALNEMGATTKTVFQSNGAMVVKFPTMFDGDDLLARARELNARDDVEYVEANTILHAFVMPNDPSFAKQYGMKNTTTAGADIHATEAWDVSTGSKKVLVGIIDTGVDYNHPDIAPNYWTNPGESGLDADGKDKRTNGVDDDKNGFVDDYRGWDFANNDNDPVDDQDHGTHCAGVIGAKGNDGVGVAGVNWDVSIVGIKFLTKDGSGSLENAVKSIEYATNLGVTLTSNSWGGGGASPTMLDAIKKANDKGILFVAAAGNDSNDNDKRASYPATYAVDNIISVAASDSKDAKASFSNWGKNTVHVAAPGVDIYSTIKGNAYKSMSGTSMATPHVAGVAALVKAVFPNATAAQIKARIINTSDPVAGWENYVQSGGRLNATSALEVDNVPPSRVAGLEVKSATTTTVTLRWTPAGDDGANGAAKAYQIRRSDKAIANEADWAAATPVTAAIKATAAEVTAIVNFESFDQKGYFAVRALDNVGNRGDASKSVQFATRPTAKVYDRSATSIDGFTADAPWAIEDLGAAGKVFSDSPGEKYKEKVNVSLTSDAINIASDDLTLAVSLKYDLENNYDFLFVEVSSDNGTTWKAVAKYTGASGDFVQKVVSLRESSRDASSIRVRFRLQSDSTGNRDGALIRNITIVGPKA